MTSRHSRKHPRSFKMSLAKRVSRRVLAIGLLSAGFAAAQDPTAVSSKKPNILFVIDTSGSMEYVTGSDSYPSCYPDQPNPALHTKSRWIEVLEVLTGKIQNYACAAEDRDSSNFIDEFSMFDGTEPPDAKYRNPYHRPLSNGCAITAERSAAASLTNAFEWAPPVQTPYPVNPTLPLTACVTPFVQDPDGFIDTNNDLARFGLMTFDPLPDAQRGYSGAPSYTPQYGAGVEGTWSYYGTVATGKPADCITDQILEVGVRNGAAPATEGKMIYFGDQDLSSTLDAARHDRIQQVLLGTRPYGGTPLNGALADARFFFLQDSDKEPLCDATASGTTLYGTAQSDLKLSPRFDQYVECGCREQHIILITDGEPNLDLRPHCEQTGTPNGICPFPMKPEAILADLANTETAGACNDAAPGASRHKIETHVVGFAINTYDSGTKQCDDLRTDVSDWNVDGGTCDTTTDEDLKVCCTLHRLANAGNVADNDDADGDGITDVGVGMPHIAPDAATLRAALSRIMAQISGSSASATRPARSPGIGLADNTMKAFRLLTSYDPSWAVDGLWYGNIERLRWTCDASNVPTEQAKLVSAGDDFHRNVAQNLSTRNFVTFVPDSTGTGGDETLRPFLASGVDDGAGVRGGTQVSGNRAAMKSDIPPEALELNFATDSGCVGTGATDNNTCRDQIIDWTLGYDDGAGNNRCPNPSDERNCSVIGDILHSTPTIVDRPTAVVDDETYETFATNNRGRMMMAYVSSNDGQLHAFGTSPNDVGDGSVSTLENNERYSFLPPAVLPRLKSQYPGAGLGTRMQLLDGVAVVQDVISTGTTTNPLFARDLTSVEEEVSSWRTVLVQAFGGQQPGYFALDITDDSSPIFLWQITTNSAGTPLFGTGGQPLITTVNLGGVETAVAVLPGGSGGSPLGGPCERSNPTASSTWTETHFDDTITGSAFEPRPKVNCYAASDKAARSLTIVRLDSGQILRRFIRDPSDPTDALLLTGVFGQSPTPGDPYLDSPITGAPAAYPAGTGMVADRIFVGDQDGTLWRVDVSTLDADEWSMQLFFDAFATDGATSGKPIVVPPVLSVDQRGRITVNFATGDQDLSGSAGENQYVYSLTEVEDASGTKFAAQVNWATRLTDGEHVVGPLSLLDGTLYFTTVAPAEQNVCQSAPASIWGVDYLERADPTANVFSGGIARLQPATESAPAQSFLVAELVDGAGAQNAGQVFGVSLEYVPSCTTPTTITDQYTGGSRTSAISTSPPALQLVFQTSGDTAQSDLGFNTSFQAVNLVQSRTASTIQSWAAVLD